jgi:hypothetical protein
MTTERYEVTHPRMQQAVAELEGLILARYPDAAFEVSVGEDPEGVYLAVTVDLDDGTPVLETVRERLLHYQVDEQLPVFVVPLRPVERVLSELEPRARKSRPVANLGTHLAAP